MRETADADDGAVGDVARLAVSGTRGWELGGSGWLLLARKGAQTQLESSNSGPRQEGQQRRQLEEAGAGRGRGEHSGDQESTDASADAAPAGAGAGLLERALAAAQQGSTQEEPVPSCWGERGRRQAAARDAEGDRGPGEPGGAPARGGREVQPFHGAAVRVPLGWQQSDRGGERAGIFRAAAAAHDRKRAVWSDEGRGGASPGGEGPRGAGEIHRTQGQGRCYQLRSLACQRHFQSGAGRVPDRARAAASADQEHHTDPGALVARASGRHWIPLLPRQQRDGVPGGDRRVQGAGRAPDSEGSGVCDSGLQRGQPQRHDRGHCQEPDGSGAARAVQAESSPPQDGQEEDVFGLRRGDDRGDLLRHGQDGFGHHVAAGPGRRVHAERLLRQEGVSDPERDIRARDRQEGGRQAGGRERGPVRGGVKEKEEEERKEKERERVNKNQMFIPWMLTHKAMHSLYGNSQSRSQRSQLPRYLRELQTDFDGNNWNSAPQRSAPAPAPAQIEDVMEESPPRRRKPNRNGQKNKRTKEAEHDNDASREEDNSSIKWTPNAEQTILFEQSNRHGTRLESDEVEEIRVTALQKNVAVILQTECRISTEKAQYLKMRFHHSFFAAPSAEQRIDAYLKKHHRQEIQMSEDPLNTESKHEADCVLNQAKEKLRTHPDQYWKGGIALYINEAVFPVARELEVSADHILVQLTDTKKQTMLILAVYGPAHSATENNLFFNETISRIHEKYQNVPILQMGDHNACFSLQRDLAQSNVPPKKQTSKTAFEHVAHSANLVDLRRSLKSQSSIYTFEKNTQNGKRYKANLDYFVANQKWIETFGGKAVSISVKETPPAGYDHKPLILVLRQHTKKVREPKQTRYIRQLNDDQISDLKAQIEKVPRNVDRPIDAISQLRSVMTAFQNEHLNCDKLETKDGKGTRRGNKLTSAYVAVKRKAELVHKTALLAAALDGDDVSDLSAETELDQRDTSVRARLQRTLRKLRDLGGEAQLVAPGQRGRNRWIDDLGKARKRLLNSKRALLRKMRRNRIQSHVRELIESFSQEPRKFYRKIRNMLQKQTPGLTAVYTKDANGATTVSSDPETVQEEARAFYEQLYASRGDANDEFDAWLTRRTPSPESVQKLERPVTKEEIQEVIRDLANNKACGEDNLPAELYKAVQDNERFQEILLDATSKLITGEERIPAEWRLSHMILLHKNGDKYDIANYRPITLVNVVYKAYSTILTKRLADFVESNDFLHRSQCGFRPGRSTAHKLAAVNAFLMEAQRERKEAHVVSIDVKKAYDSVEHWIIRRTLGTKGLNLPQPFLNAIMDTLEATSVRVRVAGGLSKECKIERGVRQGDPISPLLFNIAIDPLLRRIDERNTEPHDLTGPHAYADDVDLAHFTHAAMEQTWAHVLDFLRVTHLEANAKKTTYARNRLAEERNHSADLKIDGEPLTKLGATQPFRVLGVHFTMELDWTYEKSLATGKFKGALRNVVKRAVTDIQLIEIINVMQLSALSYGMVVVPYTDDELKKLNEILHDTIRRRLRITTDPKGWTDWMTLKREDGGFGVYNIKDLHDANQVNGLMMVANGPDTPAKRALARHMREKSTDLNAVETTDGSPLARVLQVLEDRGATLHNVRRNVNPVAILNQIADSKLLNEWKRTIPIANPTTEQIANLLLKEGPAEWRLRDPEDLQKELNHVSDITGQTITLAATITVHQKIKEAIVRLKLDPITNPADTMRALRRNAQLERDLGPHQFVVEQSPSSILHQLQERRWAVRTTEEVETAVAAIDGNDRNDVMLEPLGDNQQRALTTLLKKISDETVEKDRTTDMRGPLNKSTRCQRISMFGDEWEISFTDGSRKRTDEKERAGWGAFLPQNVKTAAAAFNKDRFERPGTCFRDRVEGAQTNQRAELAAIYAALRAKNGSNANQLIVTDSESSIKLLDGWKNGFSSNTKRKCRNRDLVRLIVKAESEIRGQVKLIHIFSHQDKADAARKVKIAAQRAAYGPMYDHLVQGNEAADTLAGKAAGEHTNYRDWAQTPMAGVDATYIAQNGNFVDAAPHSWIKEGTQADILQRQKGSKKARAEYLQLLPLCDKKRSFAAGARGKHGSHATYVTLAKLRFHAAPTATKNHRRHRALNVDNPYKKFFQALYPDDKCHACTKQGVAIKEDTKHMLECPNRPERDDAARKLWGDVYMLLEKNQSEQARTRNVRQLKPFALRTQEVLHLHSPGAGGGRPLAPALASVAAFPDAAAALGLIPKDLEAALQELGVEKAGEVADTVAAMVQTIVAADVKARHRVIATERGQKLLFRVHVLGSPAPPPPA